PCAVHSFPTRRSSDLLPGICAAQAHAATVYQSPLQQRELNYTTKIGLAALDAAACPREILAGDVIKPVPGFPGLVAVSLGGHTPDRKSTRLNSSHVKI